MSPLPVCRAHELAECSEERRWLVEGLWSDQAVGIVGGEPKCCKSFLALDVAIAVATGTPCLRRFAVPQPGRVLLFAAEDALHVVRARLEGICRAASVAFDAALDVNVITAETLRLDLAEDRLRLHETVDALRPKLLVLDPFVRLHRRDENAAGDVAPLLAYLRELQRRFGTAVLLVHHARKGAAHARGGQALRGSSELHAWGDSNLYLRRRGPELQLSIEHRAAPSRTGLGLELREAPALALHVVRDGDQADAAEDGSEASDGRQLRRVLDALEAAAAPMTARALREACRMKTSHLGTALATLIAAGEVVRTPEGYATPA